MSATSKVLHRTPEDVTEIPIRELLESDKTTLSIEHDGRPIVKPNAEKVRFDRIRIRSLTQVGRSLELSFSVNFVLSDDDIVESEEEGGGDETGARSDDWGLTNTLEERAEREESTEEVSTGKSPDEDESGDDDDEQRNMIFSLSEGPPSAD